MSEYDRYYEVVRRIPRGRVTTYGTVATLAGLEGRARRVGYAMAAVKDDDIPWHRVINARGEISPRTGGSGHRVQRALLEAEGVPFDEQDRIDLNTFGWP